MTFNFKIKPVFPMDAMQLRGAINSDGWGLSFYEDGAAIVFKEPIDIRKSMLYNFLKTYSLIKTKTFLLHVRSANTGEINFKNTHPFKRILKGKEYVFMHNGQIKNFKNLEIDECYLPIGTTDSEYIFCYLLRKIEKRKICKWDKESFDWLLQQIFYINNSGTLNFLMSQGEYLFCYYDKNRFDTLYYSKIEKISDHFKVKFVDLNEEFEINCGIEDEELKKKLKGYIISTKPLTEVGWIPFKPAQLMVFKEGELLYSS